MKEKGWGVRELARRAGVSHPIISDALNGKGASFDTCKALAFLFRVPAEQVLRMAGLLPNKTAKVEIVERAEHLYGLLTLDNQRKALEYLEFLKQQEEKGEYRVIKTEMPETG
jgi:transcriptional regulator with XRE-family HTH domain